MSHTLKILLLLVLSIPAIAQKIEVQQDLGAWIGIEIEKDLPKKFEWSLSTQVRTSRNSSRLDSYLAQTGIGYRINKTFALGGHVRYIHDRKSSSIQENSWRYHLDFKFKLKPLKKVTLAYRLRYQQKFIDAFGRKKYPLADIKSTIRHQIKMQWKVHKKHKLHTAAELFIAVHELDEYPYLDKIRLSLGDKIKTKIGTFDLSIGYEKNLQANDTFSFFFLKAIYQLSL